MGEPVPAGSDVSAGTYRCTECGYQLEVRSTEHLPPCPKCSNGSWHTESGGDSTDDPYPNRQPAGGLEARRRRSIEAKEDVWL